MLSSTQKIAFNQASEKSCQIKGIDEQVMNYIQNAIKLDKLTKQDISRIFNIP